MTLKNACKCKNCGHVPSIPAANKIMTMKREEL
jgi:hypothetical protein